MKFLVRSHWGEALPIALRLQLEGNEVQMFISDPASKAIGDGLVRKAVDFGRAVQWSEVVVYESNTVEAEADLDLPQEAELVRAIRPTLGSSALAGRLENDRLFAIETARKAGLTVPDTIKSFDGPNAWSAARAYLQGADQDQAFVWKPNGEAPAQTYVANNLSEMDRMLRHFAQLYVAHHEKPSFILTPRIDGVEVSTEGWWDGTGFSFLNHTIERNRLMAGDLGEKTGCMGNVVWLAPESRLADKLILPLKQILGVHYRGPVDVNAIIRDEDNEPVFLEFTPRFGYDAVHAFMELVDDFGKLVSDCAHGQLGRVEGSKEAELGTFAAAYRVTIAPFPEEAKPEDELKPTGVPIFGLDADSEDLRHFHLTEARLDHEDQLETSGPGGFVLVVSATGASPEEAMRAAYKRGEQVCVPQARWRSDLGVATQEVYDRLVGTGWLPLLSGAEAPLSIFGTPARNARRSSRGVSVAEAAVSMDDGGSRSHILDTLPHIFGRR